MENKGEVVGESNVGVVGGGEVSERKQVEDYLTLHCVEETLNVVVNELLEERPPNPFQQLSRLLLTRPVPEILQISVRSVLCCGGFGGVRVSVQTNLDRFEATVAAPNKRPGVEGLASYTQQEQILMKILQGQDPKQQAKIDQLLQRETSIDKYVAMAVSMACCRAGASHSNLPLYKHVADLAEQMQISIPTVEVGVVNGCDAERGRPFENIFILPLHTANARAGIEGVHKVHQAFAEIMQEKKPLVLSAYGNPTVPHDSDVMTSLRAALELLEQAIRKAGVSIPFSLGVDASLGAHAMINPDNNSLIGYSSLSGAVFAGVDLVDNFASLWRDFNLHAVEDPFHGQDLVAYRALKLKIASAVAADSALKKLEVVGDSFVTSHEDVERLVDEAFITTTMLRLEKFKTVSGCIACARKTKAAGWSIVVGSSELTYDASDDFIVDLAVGLNAGRVRIGGIDAMQVSEKLNRLLRIEEEAQNELRFVGDNYKT